MRVAFVLVALVLSAVVGTGPAGAAELGDFRWERRPLLVFAPSDKDPRLTETVSRIEATRCNFVGRDMVLGVVVTEGTSTLDGQRVDAGQSRRLRSQFAMGEDAFGVVLVGKDGGEKLRTDEVPDLQRFYTVIDGMPMRGQEMGARPTRC